MQAASPRPAHYHVRQPVITPVRKIRVRCGGHGGQPCPGGEPDSVRNNVTPDLGRANDTPFLSRVRVNGTWSDLDKTCCAVASSDITCVNTQLTLEPFVVQIWSCPPGHFKAAKPSHSTVNKEARVSSPQLTKPGMFCTGRVTRLVPRSPGIRQQPSTQPEKARSR